MTTNNNLDALFADAELPFGRPGRRSDHTPEGFEPSPLVDQGPERDYTPDEYGRVIHYGPRDRPLCGNDSVTAVYTDDPAAVAGCRDCLELVAEGHDPYLPQDLWGMFPDDLEDSELGEIPEGWEVMPLSKVSDVNPESWSSKNRPNGVEYVDLANTKWGVIESTQYFPWNEAPSRARRVLRPGDTLVGTVRPANGSYSFVGNDGLTGSTGFAVLRPSHRRYRELVYLSASAPDNIDWLAHLADGAAYPAVRPETVGETKIAIPTSDTKVLDWFSKTIGPVLDKAETNKTESQSLTAQRDPLLPELVPGAWGIGDDGIHA